MPRVDQSVMIKLHFFARGASPSIDELHAQTCRDKPINSGTTVRANIITIYYTPLDLFNGEQLYTCRTKRAFIKYDKFGFKTEIIAIRCEHLLLNAHLDMHSLFI